MSGGDVLAFEYTADCGLKARSELSTSAMRLRPDSVAIWTPSNSSLIEATLSNGARPGKKSTDSIFWTDVVSIQEAKVSLKTGVYQQVASYAHYLPRYLPNLAGMLYLIYDLQRITVAWSDNSCTVRTPSIYYVPVKETDEKPEAGAEQESDTFRDFLYSYVYTLYRPRKDRPQRDPTMRLDLVTLEDGSQRERWIFNHYGKEIVAELIVAGTHVSRQTCIFKVLSPFQGVLKDIWLDIMRRFKEHLLLEKSERCPGLIQRKESQRVEGSDADGFLSCHGANITAVESTDRHKWRHAINTFGEPLKNSTSALHLLKTIFDSLQGEFGSPSSRFFR